MAVNPSPRPSWWELASAGTITCTSLTGLSLWLHAEAARALPIYSGGGAVNVDGVVAGANASIRVTADRGLVRWQDFSVQAGERFRIEGQANQSILNVVTGPDASRIAGVVESGPRFLLANPNGIEVLGTGQIIAPSTWLTTGRVREDDWLQQRAAIPGGDATYPHIQLDRQTAINVAGTVYADDGPHGGEVTLLAHDIDLASTALIAANGPSGGGTIHVGGQAHGLGPGPTATRVTVAPGARLEANATKSGSGGEVVIWSEDSTRFGGQIQAQGGPEGGDGGFVEVSGRQYLDFQGLVSTMAPLGQTGTLLLDPIDLTISNVSDANITSAAGVAVPTATPSFLSWSTINTTLGSTSLLVKTTGTTGAGTGAITIDAASPDLLNLAGKTLTFEAAGDIKINKTVSSTASSGSLVFTAGTVGSNNTISVAYGKQVKVNQATFTADTIKLNGGTDDQVITTGDQQYNGVLTLAGTTGLSGNSVAFTSAITGANDLTLNFSGITDLTQGVTGLQSLTVNNVTTGKEVRLAGSLSTAKTQDYSSPVVLAADTTLTSTGSGTNGSISFAGKVDGAYRLNITTTASPTGGSVSFLGAVGSSTPLSELKVQSQTVALADVSTQGNQTYQAASDITTSGSLLASSSGAAISFTGKQLYLQGPTSVKTNVGKVNFLADVNNFISGSPKNLTVDVQGKADIAFGSSIGASNRVGDLKIYTFSNVLIPGTVYAKSLAVYGDSIALGGGGTIAINGGLVDTQGNLVIQNSLTLGAATTLQSSAPGSRIRVYKVDSKSTPVSLAIKNSSGNVDFYGNVGSTSLLGDITVDAGGTTSFGNPTGIAKTTITAGSLTTDSHGDLAFDLHGGEIITTGSQTYNDAGGAVIGSDLRLSTTGGAASHLVVAGPIDAAVATAPNLTIDVTGLATFTGAIGANVPLGTISIDNSLGTQFADSLAADTLVFQSSIGITSGKNYLKFLGNLTLATALTFNPSQALNYQSPVDVSLLGLANSIGASPTGIVGATVFDNTGVLTIGNSAATSNTLFASGIQAFSASAISLAGKIQAGTKGDGIMDFDGTIELRHDNTANTPDPVALFGGVVKLSGTVDSSAGQHVALTIDTSGDLVNGMVNLVGAIGGTQSLASIATTNALGSLSIDSPSIITEGGQSYAEAKAELFGHDLTLQSNKTGLVAFDGALDISTGAAVALHVITDGTSRFSGPIGFNNPLSELSTANLNLTTGITELKGGGVTTLGNQTYGQLVSLGSNATLTSTKSGTIRFSESLNGAKALTLDTGGAIDLQKSIGSTTALTSLTTVSKTGITTLKGGSVTTTGLQSFAGPLLLGDTTTLESTSSGAITLAGTVDSASPSNAYGLTIKTAGLTTLAADIGKTNLLGTLTTDSKGSLTITASKITTTGNQTYNESAITIGAKAGDLTTLNSTTGFNLSLGFASGDHLDGPGALQLTTTGDASISGVAGATTPLTSLTINASNIDLHDVTTTNQQVYTATGKITTHSSYITTAPGQSVSFTGPVVLADDMTVITDEGVVTFNSRLDSDPIISPRNLTVNTSSGHVGGDILFLGDVGSIAPLGNVTLLGSGINLIQGLFTALSLAADTTGTTQLAGGSVITTNNQIYQSPVELKQNTVLTSTSGGAIAFEDSLTSPTTPYDLVINTSGSTFFDGPVGEDQATNAHPLKSLTTDAPGFVRFNGGLVRTTGAQTYSDQALLGADLLLRSDSSGAITLAAIDAINSGLSALDIDTAGLTTFGGAVGSITPLTRISTDQPGTVLLNAGSITTLDDQVYNELLGVTLGADTVLRATVATPTIRFTGPVNGILSGQQSLAIYTQGLTHFGGAVGQQVALESVFTDGAPSVTNTVEVQGGSVTTTGFQTYGESVLVKAANPNNTRFIAGGPISFSGPVDLDATGAPGHLTIEAPDSSVSFAQDVGLQTQFLTVTVLTGDLNLSSATINVNGWDALNPNSFQSVQTSATIALQGTRSVNSSRSGGMQGGSVFNLQNATANNSRWLVWSYAPWTNVQETPADSVLNLYGVQYLTPYNQTIQIAPYVNGNQFLYLVDRTPPPPPPPAPDVVPFEDVLNTLLPQTPLNLYQTVVPLESLPSYVNRGPGAVVVSSSTTEADQGSGEGVFLAGSLSDEDAADLLLAFSQPEVLSDINLGLVWQAKPAASLAYALSQAPPRVQSGDSLGGFNNASAKADDDTPASVEFPSYPLNGTAGSRAAAEQALASASTNPLLVYQIPRSRLIGFPTTPVRLEDMQITGYQFSGHSYVPLPRNRKGEYRVEAWMSQQPVQHLNFREALASQGEPTALEVVIDRRRLQPTLATELRGAALERLTIAVPTVFGTVINLDIPMIGLLKPG